MKHRPATPGAVRPAGAETPGWPAQWLFITTPSTWAPPSRKP